MSDKNSEKDGVEQLISSLENVSLQSSQQQTDQQADEPEVYSPRLEDIAQQILNGQIKNVICLVGAGISVSAGIPDFRSKGSGLFDNLQKYDLPSPEAVFQIDFFEDNPMPFYKLMKQLMPTKFKPTPTHYFMKLLHGKGVLRRVWSQNIDSLEVRAGLPKDLLVAAHGNFDSAHCFRCKQEYSIEELLREVEADEVPVRCKNKKCNRFVKPDIVFYGENLPDRFFKLLDDFNLCDLLIVMGTSLKVTPFSNLVHLVGHKVPRILINRECVGPFESNDNDNNCNYNTIKKDFNSNQKQGREQFVKRNVVWLGDCDDGVKEFVELLNWSEEFVKICSDNKR
eukprot:TRINITY_DN9049_c0_g4_i1.p1 TRINITY_DN9049_c0_g4~~TRINITY_DN9049_c0_g4_i1.p1  ORF type:complete len:382 (-),score=43.39 TRINITY_DN9049_c0_g4_i1:277-1296(-)